MTKNSLYWQALKQQIIDKVEEHGRERRRLHGQDFSEVDYLMGAGAALEALDLWPPPPRWVFGVMMPTLVFPCPNGADRYNDYEQIHHLERKIRDIQEANSWSPRGAELYRKGRFGHYGNILVVEADGCGGASVQERDWDYSEKAEMVREDCTVNDEQRAVEFAEWLAMQEYDQRWYSDGYERWEAEQREEYES